MIQGGSSPGRDSSESEEEEDDEEDEDEQIIVTMLQSMNSKKLETHQLAEMKLDVDIDKIRSEIKLEFFKEI